MKNKDMQGGAYIISLYTDEFTETSVCILHR